MYFFQEDDSISETGVLLNKPQPSGNLLRHQLDKRRVTINPCIESQTLKKDFKYKTRSRQESTV